MNNRFDDDMVRHAIIHIKAGEFDSARRLLERALISADDYDTRSSAYFHLSEITNDPQEKRKYLEEVLAIDANHPLARRSLAILDGKLDPHSIVNPDALPAPAPGEQKVTARRFTCPQCGGRMVFDGDGRTLICEQCNIRQTPQGQPVTAETDFFVAMASGAGHRTPVNTQLFHCQGCGAEFVLPPQVISSTCAYCASAHVVTQTRDIVPPDAIIPMQFNQRGAAVRLVHWVEALKIIPQGKVQAPRGVYLPVWTFDIFGAIPWRGQVYRNKRIVDVSGTYTLLYDDLPILATQKVGELFSRALPGYRFSEAATYDPRYLAGWPAEVYETAMSDASLRAREQSVKQAQREVVLANPNMSNFSYSTNGISAQSFKLILVPAWVTTYRAGGRPCRVLINGQDGRVHGQTPRGDIVSTPQA